MCIAATTFGCSSLRAPRLQECKTVYSVAHRGCVIGDIIPENSLAAVEYAARYGYRAVECDPKYTADSVIVLQHDQSLNRCMRFASGYATVIEKTFIEDLTFKELNEKYVLSSSETAQRVPAPTLQEFIQSCRKYHIVPMVHSDVYDILRTACEESGGNFIAFGTNYNTLKRIRKISDCMILWDPGQLSAAETIHKLQQIGGRCGVSSMNRQLLTADYIQSLHEAGFSVQSSIFPPPYEMQCIADGADIVLSDFHLSAPVKTKPWKKTRLRNIQLEKEKSLSLAYDSTVYGSVELSVEFQGEIEILINNKYTYHLQNKSNKTKVYKGGWRCYQQAAEVRITAREDSDIHTLQIRTYKY